MSTDGFRLHRAAVHEGLYGRKHLVFHEGLLKDPQGVLNATLSRAGNQQLNAGVLLRNDPRDVENLRDNDPILRIDSHKWFNSRTLGIELSYGNVGAFESAMNPDDGTEVDLRRMAPYRRHSIVFYLPTAGDKAIVAASARGRKSLGPMLLKVFAALDGQYAPENSAVLKWTSVPLFDSSRIDQVVEEGELRGLELKAMTIKKNGAPESRTVHITQNGILKEDKTMASRIIRRWLQSYIDRKSLAGDLDLSVMAGMLAVDVESNDFTDGKFVFRMDGRTQSVGPHNLERILTYPMSEDPGNVDTLHAEASERLKAIQGIIKIPLGL